MYPTILTLELSGSKRLIKNLLWSDWLATAERNQRNCLGQVPNVRFPAGHYTSSPHYTLPPSTLKEDINTSTCSSNLSPTPMAPSAGNSPSHYSQSKTSLTNHQVHRRNQHHPHRRRRHRRILRLDLGNPV
jgi:hypothetical protein